MLTMPALPASAVALLEGTVAPMLAAPIRDGVRDTMGDRLKVQVMTELQQNGHTNDSHIKGMRHILTAFGKSIDGVCTCHCEGCHNSRDDRSPACTLNAAALPQPVRTCRCDMCEHPGCEGECEPCDDADCSQCHGHGRRSDCSVCDPHPDDCRCNNC